MVHNEMVWYRKGLFEGDSNLYLLSEVFTIRIGLCTVYEVGAE